MKNKKIVYAAGVFDIIHYGHIKYLEESKKLGDYLIVGLLTDRGTARYKQAPINNYDSRYKVIEALRCVDRIVKQNDTDPTLTLKNLYKEGVKVDILVRADDINYDPPGKKFIEKNGGKVHILKYTNTISSSDIKLKIINRHFSSL